MEEMRDFYRETILVKKTEGKTLLGKPRHRWVGNNKMDLKEIEEY
jgi:hypothetical protein